MENSSEHKPDFQADVHFALGAVIQGITVAALGSEFADVLRSLPFPGAGWAFVTGAQSLLMCILFWYSFISNYYFAFRVIILTAKTHFAIAAHYLVLGLLQLIAIQFLTKPRLWMTFHALLVVATLAGSWLSSHVPVIDDDRARRAFEYEPNSIAFLTTSFVSVGFLIAWYAVPGIDAVPFRAAALSVSGLWLVWLTVDNIRLFQHHQDAV